MNGIIEFNRVVSVVILPIYNKAIWVTRCRRVGKIVVEERAFCRITLQPSDGTVFNCSWSSVVLRSKQFAFSLLLCDEPAKKDQKEIFSSIQRNYNSDGCSKSMGWRSTRRLGACQHFQRQRVSIYFAM